MENQCPECEEQMSPDGEYKGVVVYICPNRHRSAFIDEEGKNVPLFKSA